MLQRLRHVPHTSGWELVAAAGLVAVTLEDEAEATCLSLRDRHCTVHLALEVDALGGLIAALQDAQQRMLATKVPPAA